MTAPGTQGEVSPESMGKTASSAVGSPRLETRLSRITGNHAEQSRLKPCRGKPFHLWKELKFESQNPVYQLHRESVGDKMCRITSEELMEIDKTLTAGGGAPVNDNQNSPTAGPKAPILIEERKYRWRPGRLPDDYPGLSSIRI